MGWFLISRHALGQFSKLLLEVSVYECGCSLRFVSVGSNIVPTSAQLAKMANFDPLKWRLTERHLASLEFVTYVDSQQGDVGNAGT